MVEWWWICCSFCKLSSWCPSSMFLFHSPSSVLPSTLTHTHRHTYAYLFIYPYISRKRQFSVSVDHAINEIVALQYETSTCAPGVRSVFKLHIQPLHDLINQKINTLFLFSPFLTERGQLHQFIFLRAFEGRPWQIIVDGLPFIPPLSPYLLLSFRLTDMPFRRRRVSQGSLFQQFHHQSTSIPASLVLVTDMFPFRRRRVSQGLLSQEFHSGW